MRQHYAPYNRSEESHRRTDGTYTLHIGRGIFRYAQYDVLFSHVILNDSEESHRRTDGANTLLLSRGIFRYAQYVLSDGKT